MSTLSLRLPDSLHEKVKELAKAENISINQFISTAIAEKMSALATETYLEERAKRGSKQKFRHALNKVKDVTPDSEDQLPVDLK